MDGPRRAYLARTTPRSTPRSEQRAPPSSSPARGVQDPSVADLADAAHQPVHRRPHACVRRRADQRLEAIQEHYAWSSSAIRPPRTGLIPEAITAPEDIHDPTAFYARPRGRALPSPAPATLATNNWAGRAAGRQPSGRPISWCGSRLPGRPAGGPRPPFAGLRALEQHARLEGQRHHVAALPAARHGRDHEGAEVHRLVLPRRRAAVPHPVRGRRCPSSTTGSRSRLFGVDLARIFPSTSPVPACAAVPAGGPRPVPGGRDLRPDHLGPEPKGQHYLSYGLLWRARARGGRVRRHRHQHLRTPVGGGLALLHPAVGVPGPAPHVPDPADHRTRAVVPDHRARDPLAPAHRVESLAMPWLFAYAAPRSPRSTPWAAGDQRVAPDRRAPSSGGSGWSTCGSRTSSSCSPP